MYFGRATLKGSRKRNSNAVRSAADLTLAVSVSPNMSEEATPLPNVGGGLLGASRARSYGSLVRSRLSPAHHRCIEHMIQPGETLQGLALKYGVSVSTASVVLSLSLSIFQSCISVEKVWASFKVKCIVT